MRKALLILIVLFGVFTAIGCTDTGDEVPEPTDEEGAEITPADEDEVVEVVTPVEVVTGEEVVTPVEAVEEVTPIVEETPVVEVTPVEEPIEDATPVED